MQEKGSLQLFEEFHASLTEFITHYRTDHPTLLNIEIHCLKTLESIASELGHFLRDKSSPEKFTFDKYEIFITRIESVKPPQETVKTQKSTGFLGIIGASESSEKVTVGLHNAMNRLMTNLTAKAVEAKAKAKETSEKTRSSEKTHPLEEKKVPNETDLRLANLEQRMATAEERAYERGRKEEREEIIRRVRQRLTGPQQQQMLLLLEDAKSPETINSSSMSSFNSSSSSSSSTSSTSVPMSSTSSTNTATSSTSSTNTATSSTNSPVPVVFSTISEIKEDTQEAKEAKQHIDKIKFEPIEQLVTFHSNQVSEREKIIARWLIFELMSYEHNPANTQTLSTQTISSIFQGIKEQLLKRCGLDVAQLSNLNHIFEMGLKNHNVVTTQALSAEKLIAFYKLTSESAICLPKDITASNYFGSRAARLKGQNVEATTKESYVDNAVKKLNDLMLGASTSQMKKN